MKRASTLKFGTGILACAHFLELRHTHTRPSCLVAAVVAVVIIHQLTSQCHTHAAQTAEN